MELALGIAIGVGIYSILGALLIGYGWHWLQRRSTVFALLGGFLDGLSREHWGLEVLDENGDRVRIRFVELREAFARLQAALDRGEKTPMSYQ